MLKLPNKIGDKKADDILSKHINSRLIDIMERIILDEVAFMMAMKGELDPKDADKSFEEMVDLNALMMAQEFAEFVKMMFLPENYPVSKANKVFFGLYKLLKAKKEYVPDLVMEYVLNSVIESEIGEVDMINDVMMDDLDDEDEDYSTVLPIPEPDRSYVKSCLIKDYKSEYESEELEIVVEDVLGYYEDLRGYLDSCFWDTDFLLLDDYTEEQLLKSDANKSLGIMNPKENNIIEFPFTGKDGKQSNVRAEVDIDPWDLEDE